MYSFRYLFQGFLQYGVPSTPEKLLALMNKVHLRTLFMLTLNGYWQYFPCFAKYENKQIVKLIIDPSNLT